MKVKEAIELINNSDNYYYSLWEVKDLLRDCKFIHRQDYDYSHKWFIKSTDIYEAEDGYIGIKGFAEYTSYVKGFFTDCDVHCIAEEYEIVQTITYIPKTK